MVNEMMLYQGLLFSVRNCSANNHFTVNLPRISINDLGAKIPGEPDSHIGFANCRWTGHNYERFIAHVILITGGMRNYFSWCCTLSNITIKTSPIIKKTVMA